MEEIQTTNQPASQRGDATTGSQDVDAVAVNQGGESAAAELPGLWDYARMRLRLGGAPGSFSLSAAVGGVAVWEWVTYGALLIAAAAMRLYDLGSRALHHDESLHSFYSWKLMDGQGFRHDPLMHGPFQFEANAAIFFIFGDSDFTSRLLYAAAGVALVALPFFFRGRLGKLGAAFTAAMLAFSPAMLYFSRFARNDILMAAFVLGIVICMWRYIDEGKSRYIYIAAALLALAFASKETAYLITALLGMYLALYLLAKNSPAILRGVGVRYGETAAGAAIAGTVGAYWRYANSVGVAKLTRPAAFLLILITLTMPQWSAAIGLFQDAWPLSWTNLTFVTMDGEGDTGSPVGGAIAVSFVIVVAMLAISMLFGLNWDAKTWAIAAAIFYAVWLPLYTTFFTNIDGIDTGVWRALGYWIAQQDVARGNQPWYYYLIITPLYEFLPLALALAAAAYHWIKRRADAFTLFLFFWAGMTWLLFTIASEKMPWLLVNITLPLIVLAGKFAGDIASRVDWRRFAGYEGVALLVGVPLFLAALYRLALHGAGDDVGARPIVAVLYGLALAALIAGGAFIARRLGVRRFALFAAAPLTLILFALTVRAGVVASYRNGDVPVEMLVYTQTSPDIVRLADELRRSNADSGGNGLQLSVDSASGFTWPWAWYLRDGEKYRASYDDISAAAYEAGPPAAPVVLVHSNNLEGVKPALAADYTEAERVKHRWWFPEHTYRSLTPARIFSGVMDRGAWRSLADYWLFREGVRHNIGSEDAYVFFKTDFPQNYTPYEHGE